MIKKYLDFINENSSDSSNEIVDLYNKLKSNYPDLKIELEKPYSSGTWISGESLPDLPEITIYTYIKEGERWEQKGLIISFEDDEFTYQELDANYGQDYTDKYEGYSDEAYEEGPVAIVDEFIKNNSIEYKGEVPYVEIGDSIDVYHNGEIHKMKVYDTEDEYDAGGGEFQNIYAETEDGRSAYVVYQFQDDKEKEGRFELQWWN